MSTYFITGKYEKKDNSTYYTHINEFSEIVDVIGEVRRDEILTALKNHLSKYVKNYLRLITITNIVKL